MDNSDGKQLDENVGKEDLEWLEKALKTFDNAESAPSIRIKEGVNYAIVPISSIQKLTVCAWEPVEGGLKTKKYIPAGLSLDTEYYRVRLHQPNYITFCHFDGLKIARNVLERIKKAIENKKTLEIGPEDGVIPIVRNEKYESDPHRGNKCDWCGTEDVALKTDFVSQHDICYHCALKKEDIKSL